MLLALSADGGVAPSRSTQAAAWDCLGGARWAADRGTYPPVADARGVARFAPVAVQAGVGTVKIRPPRMHPDIYGPDHPYRKLPLSFWKILYAVLALLFLAAGVLIVMDLLGVQKIS